MTHKKLVYQYWLLQLALCVTATLAPCFAVASASAILEENPTEIVEIEEVEEAITQRNRSSRGGLQRWVIFQIPRAENSRSAVELLQSLSEEGFIPESERDDFNGLGTYLII